MKHNEIEDLPTINVENLENIFNVHQDKDNMYYYNLLQTIVFPENLPLNLFDSYTVNSGDTWPLISHKTLNNTSLWWIILLANNIKNPIFPSLENKPAATEQAPNVFKKTKLSYGPLPGTVLKIPIMDVVREILFQMRKN
jgi:hypothetical protein